MQKTRSNDPIVDYVLQLRDYGVGSSQAEQFKANFSNDNVFLRRANVAELLFKNKELILEKLETLPD